MDPVDRVPLRRIAGIVAYDGTDFRGFQVQRSDPTIQGALEDGLLRLTGRSIRVSAAGRTDTGVHALGQVIGATIPWRHSLAALRRAWNHHLPESILVRQLIEAPAGFHPRFSATQRVYRYTVRVPALGITADQRFPLFDRFALVLPQRPDLAAMNRAAELLIGTHDFATFGQAPQSDNTTRRIDSVVWEEVEETLPSIDRMSLDRLTFTVRANAFLYRMVRNLVGALLAVGFGKWQIEQFSAAFSAKDRRCCAPPVPANGLVLEQVFYAEYPDLFAGES